MAAGRSLLDSVDRIANLPIAAANLARADRVLSAAIEPPPDPPVPALTSFDITFDGVGFGYRPGVPVLHEVSFTVAARSMTALVGPSGAGKTTALNLVAGFFHPDRGTVRIGGVDLRDLTPDQLFDAVSIVFQDVYLFAGTIRDNLVMGRPDAEDHKVTAAAKAASCHDFVMALPEGYQTVVGEGGRTLSGGQRQRISIARAILKDAPIVLLDEATAAVDPLNERLIQGALAALVADKTLLVVAHRLSTIRSADHIVALDRGRVVESGTHDDLVSRGGLYARFWAGRQQAAHWRLTTDSRNTFKRNNPLPDRRDVTA
ncbi:MAG: ABC transporter ATP-binding protein [Pseudonocardiaceae bacterium]